MAEHPNQLPVAPTNAAYGLAGLGLLGVETVNIRGAVGDGGFKEGMKGPLCAHQLEGCTVWPIFHHTHTYTHTHTLDPMLVGTQKLNLRATRAVITTRVC